MGWMMIVMGGVMRGIRRVGRRVARGRRGCARRGGRRVWQGGWCVGGFGIRGRRCVMGGMGIVMGGWMRARGGRCVIRGRRGGVGRGVRCVRRGGWCVCGGWVRWGRCVMGWMMTAMDGVMRGIRVGGRRARAGCWGRARRGWSGAWGVGCRAWRWWVRWRRGVMGGMRIVMGASMRVIRGVGWRVIPGRRGCVRGGGRCVGGVGWCVIGWWVRGGKCAMGRMMIAMGGRMKARGGRRV